MLKSENRWRAVPSDSGTIFELLNRQLIAFSEEHEDGLPEIGTGKNVFVGSDYSGEHQEADYEVYAILVAPLDSCMEWESRRSEVREKYLSDGRRMSFKALRDKRCLSALPEFLEAADHIPGLCVAFAVHKSVGSLFDNLISPRSEDPLFLPYLGWPKHVLEKAGRLAHFTGFLLGGLCSSGQNLLWITDEDAVAANVERLKQFTDLCGWITSRYLSFDMGHIRIGTTASDNGSRSVEDLVSVADIVAGAISEQLTARRRYDFIDPTKVFWLANPEFSHKTKDITWWFASVRQPLKRLVFVIDGEDNSVKTKVSFFHFHDRS